MFGISDERSYGVGEQLIPIEDANGIKIMSATWWLKRDRILFSGEVLLLLVLSNSSTASATGNLTLITCSSTCTPGTGDVALTIFQSLPVEGVVIVSSPQVLFRWL